MSGTGTLRSLRRRLAKVERELVDSARQEKLTNCICLANIIAVSTDPEQFEAEMNRPCPVHGFRRLGKIIAVNLRCTDGSEREEVARLGQLIETYKLGLARFSQSSVKLENDSRKRRLAL
jgi:hypothetical protein